MVKPRTTPLAEIPVCRISRSPRSSKVAWMSRRTSFIEGIPPCSAVVSRMFFRSLKSPTSRVPVDERGGGAVGVVLDGDDLAVGEGVEPGWQHGLLDGGLVGVAARRLDG